jgi:hypothetical protein
MTNPVDLSEHWLGILATAASKNLVKIDGHFIQQIGQNPSDAIWSFFTLLVNRGVVRDIYSTEMARLNRVVTGFDARKGTIPFVEPLKAIARIFVKAATPALDFSHLGWLEAVPLSSEDDAVSRNASEAIIDLLANDGSAIEGVWKIVNKGVQTKSRPAGQGRFGYYINFFFCEKTPSHCDRRSLAFPSGFFLPASLIRIADAGFAQVDRHAAHFHSANYADSDPQTVHPSARMGILAPVLPSA